MNPWEQTERPVNELEPMGDGASVPVRVLAEELSTQFSRLGISLRRYSVRVNRDPGAVSRYLNGARIPPWEFVHRLLVESTLHHDNAPPTKSVVIHFRRLHQTALESSGSPFHRIQLLEDKLSEADQEATLAVRREQMLEREMATARYEIAQLQVKCLELEAARDDGSQYIEQQDLYIAEADAERAALLKEIKQLQSDLAGVQKRRIAAELRCAELEHQIDSILEQQQIQGIVRSDADASEPSSAEAQIEATIEQAPDATVRQPSAPAERLTTASELLDDVHRDATRATNAATALLKGNKGDEAACIALRVLGLARKERGELAAARTALTQATGLGDKLNLPLRAAQARISLLIVLADMGRTEAAFAQAALAESALTGLGAQGAQGAQDLARFRVNFGLLLQRTGRSAEALTHFAAAEPVLVRHRDTHWEILLRNIRGPLLAHRGDYQGGARDLTRARELAHEHGYRLLAHAVSRSFGFIAAEAGDIPLALREFDLAYELAVELGKPTDTILAARADALLTVGLAQEARAGAARAAAGMLAAGFNYNAAEALLTEARAALQTGDPAAAAAGAQKARDVFARQRRPGWAALAQQVALAARFAQGERTTRLLNALQANAGHIAETGRLVEVQQSTLLAARVAAALGRRELAAHLYNQVATHRMAGSAHQRMVGWEAAAELAEYQGEAGKAARHVTQGLAVAAEYASALGATDLRAAAAGLGTDLARIGVRLAAVQSGASPAGRAAATLLVRADQWRATTLRLRPVRPPDDKHFAEQLAALRSANARIATEGADGQDVRALQTERVRLEREITSRARHAPGNMLNQAAAPEHPLDLPLLRTALGDQALIEYLNFEDLLFAITYVDGRARRHDLGLYSAALTELESLRFSMNSLAYGRGSPRVQAATRTTYDHARAELDRILLGPLIHDIGERTVVLVPTGSLHALAWPVLPSLAGRACTIAPSARSWLAGADSASADPGNLGWTRGSSRDVLLAYGPGLPDADAEIRALSGLYPHAKTLTGTDATAGAVAQALDGAYLAHLATHGRFRADNPLFSNLLLADGPLTVYDLEQLARCPEILVLSACDTALSGVAPGNELMGVASAAFGLGTRALIISVAPVSVDEVTKLMIAFHKALAGGEHPAQALAYAAQEVPQAPGFVCIGTR
jgi:tetratricopeptide (TPR) repeat protein